VSQTVGRLILAYECQSDEKEISMKNRMLMIGLAIASLVLSSLACDLGNLNDPEADGNAPVTEDLTYANLAQTQLAQLAKDSTLTAQTEEVELLAESGTRVAPSETPEGQSGGCWALVEPTSSPSRLEDDNRRTFKVTNAEGWLWSVMDWGYGGCQGQVSGLVTWTPLPDRLTPGQVIPINVTASITGTEVCSPNYDWFTYGGDAFSRFRIPPTGEEVAIARVNYPNGPLESQATYQWIVPEAGPEETWVDYHIQVNGAYYAMLNYTYTWQETGNCTPGEILVNTPVPPAAITPQP
jgi:hypothetical protein